MDYSKLAKIADSVKEEQPSLGAKCIKDNIDFFVDVKTAGKTAEDILKAFCKLKGSEACKEFISFLIEEGYPESEADCVITYIKENNLDADEILDKLVFFLDGETLKEVATETLKVEDSKPTKTIPAIIQTLKDAKKYLADHPTKKVQISDSQEFVEIKTVEDLNKVFENWESEGENDVYFTYKDKKFHVHTEFLEPADEDGYGVIYKRVDIDDVIVDETWDGVIEPFTTLEELDELISFLD